MKGELQAVAKPVKKAGGKPVPKGDTIPCIYPGEAAVLIATGPGLTEEVVETIRPFHEAGKVKVFGCNDAYKLVPFLDVHYACDGGWWNIHKEACFKALPDNCHVWTQDVRTKGNTHINLINGSHKTGLCLDNPAHIHFGSNSGYQQLNIAYHYGIRKFLLVGYNMQIVDQKSHFFGDHPMPLAQTSPYKRFVEQYGTIQDEVKEMVINCTENSALQCFKKGNLKEELEKL